MNRLYSALISLFFIASLSFFGCSSSEPSKQEKEATDKQVQQQSTPVPVPTAQKSDTIDVKQQQPAKGEQEQTQQSPTTTPQTQPMTQPADTTAGNYAVQVGAFKMGDKAEQIAATARDRFKMNVKTYLDKETGLTKVLVGSFASKDEARVFRDQIAKQFADDYKDAWVTEIPKE